jgi:Cu/Ag efflux pump CusA
VWLVTQVHCLACALPGLSTVIDRVKMSTNEIGGRVLELTCTQFMVRGYLRSLSDLENVPVIAKNRTLVLIRDLGTVSFGPDIREGVAEWNGMALLRTNMPVLPGASQIDDFGAILSLVGRLSQKWRRR